MSVFVSKANKGDYVNALSDEIRNEIMIAVEASLKEDDLEGEEFQKAWDKSFNSRVTDLEDTIDIEYMDEKLSYYVVENLRFQQDGKGGFNLTRYDKLQDAIVAFSQHPKEYTSAIGASLTGGKFGIGEIDLIHRKNGKAVQVNDFKFIERWDNPLVLRAVNELNSKLGVEYESDIRMFSQDKKFSLPVLVPVQDLKDKTLNSYFMDKYLRPVDGSTNLMTSINEVFVGGKGWRKAEKFFKKIAALEEKQSPDRLKVMQLNINYVDLNGRIGQADIKPGDFALLKKQTLERTAKHPDIDVQIDTANKIRAEQIENKRKAKEQKKNKDTQER